MATRRRRTKHQLTLRQRLEIFTEDARRSAEAGVRDDEREILHRKVQASEAALSIIDHLSRTSR